MRSVPSTARSAYRKALADLRKAEQTMGIKLHDYQREDQATLQARVQVKLACGVSRMARWQDVYHLLDVDNRAWWYNAKLRSDGKVDEARKRERMGIRNDVKHLRQMLAYGAPITWYEASGQYAVQLDKNESMSFGGYRHGAGLVEAARLIGISIVGE